jgi:FKBP-type peptidyl-prolyl cis-trans isomerase SlyD
VKETRTRWVYMQIRKDCVVSIDYMLKGDDGTVIDTSEASEPLSFIFGNGNIIPGLEKELDGKQTGDGFSVSLTPQEGYGEYDASKVFEVTRESIDGADNMVEGAQVQAQHQDGTMTVLTVTSVGEENVTLDGNHPLAGMNLHFDIEVKEVRDATAEELEHGHSHSHGHGHDHDHS